MKFLMMSLFVLLAAGVSLSAGPKRSYTNVPMLTVQSDQFNILDGRSALEAARQQCEREVVLATRLLNQKSVDIILETIPCTLYEGLQGKALFWSELYFLN